MATQIYLNLPVKDLARSKEFFTALGYSFNPKFENENGACMIISEDIFVMLLVERFFQTFIKKKIADAKQVTEAIICLSSESKAAVDEMVAKAIAAGGAALNPKMEMEFMYNHGFEDLDGHFWEFTWMDPSFAPNA